MVDALVFLAVFWTAVAVGVALASVFAWVARRQAARRVATRVVPHTPRPSRVELAARYEDRVAEHLPLPMRSRVVYPVGRPGEAPRGVVDGRHS